MKTIVMREFLELKNGSFTSTLGVLQQPDSWHDLTPQSRRLIKRYAALLAECPEDDWKKEKNWASSFRK